MVTLELRKRRDPGVGRGDNRNGQINVPAPNTGFIAFARGEEHTLGLKADGVIVPWGDSAYGQESALSKSPSGNTSDRYPKNAPPDE